MRDLAEKWSAVPDWETAAIAVPGLSIRSLAGFSQYLVSGDLAAWSGASGMETAAAGALSIATGARYGARIARDRILAVSETPFGIEPGWHDHGFAVSALDAGMHIFEIDGPAMAGIWVGATTLDPKGVTASAAVLFAGVHVLCYRHGHNDRLRIHVDRGLAPYLWKWLVQMSTL